MSRHVATYLWAELRQRAREPAHFDQMVVAARGFLRERMPPRTRIRHVAACRLVDWADSSGGTVEAANIAVRIARTALECEQRRTLEERHLAPLRGGAIEPLPIRGR